MQNALFDPLVINIGTDSAKVSNQKFKFDLDSDGKEDSISMPTRGSAFLALDKNEDGTINDGNELFGTKSGDGFKDLREYVIIFKSLSKYQLENNILNRSKLLIK